MRSTTQRTTLADLTRIARDRGREYDPKRQAVWCSECGAPLTAFGIMHFVDCSGDEAEIRFRDPES